jgi:hypothetical protein
MEKFYLHGLLRHFAPRNDEQQPTSLRMGIIKIKQREMTWKSIFS